MPAANTVVETDVTTTVSASPQLLLAAPGPGRFWVEVVNPSSSHRLFVATSSAACTAAAKAADPYGVWDGPVGNLPLYYLWETGATAAPVRVIQYS
jgi:hypothetical protein